MHKRAGAAGRCHREVSQPLYFADCAVSAKDSELRWNVTAALGVRTMGHAPRDRASSAMRPCRWFPKAKAVKHSVHVPCWDSFRINPRLWRGICFGRWASDSAHQRLQYRTASATCEVSGCLGPRAHLFNRSSGTCFATALGVRCGWQRSPSCSPRHSRSSRRSSSSRSSSSGALQSR